MASMKIQRRLVLAAVSISTASALAACSSNALPTLRQGVVPDTRHTALDGKLHPVTVRIFIPHRRHRAPSMRPFFVANGTRGIAVIVAAHGSSIPVSTTNVSVAAGSSLCKAVTGGRQCTVTAGAPPGSDDFTIKTYDAAPSGGGFSGAKQLAIGTTTKTIAAGKKNALNVTVGGVVAKAAVHLGWPVNPVIDKDVQTVTVSALDADGNTIINDGWYSASGTAVTMALSATNGNAGTFKFAPASVTFAVPKSTLTYDSTTVTESQVKNGFASTIAATPTSGAVGSAIFTLSKPAFTEFAISTVSSFPEGIVVGPDNAIWLAESNGGIGRIPTNATPGTKTTDYSNGISLSASPTMLASAGGLIWFTEFEIGKIGSIDPTTHAVHEYATPSCGSGCSQLDYPFDIVTGPDGDLWFTENSNTYSNIGTFSPSLPTAMVEYPTHTAGAGPSMIAVGPDHNLWFTEYYTNGIGKITTGGTTSPESTVPGSNTIYEGGITSGPGSMLWFAECNNPAGGSTGDRIGSVTTGGTVSQFPQLVTPQSNPLGIVQGPDGAIWFAENGNNAIGRLDPTTHTVIEFFTPTTGSAPWGIVKGPDGALWFTENDKNQVGRLK